jgi:hypothetical protein
MFLVANDMFPNTTPWVNISEGRDRRGSICWRNRINFEDNDLCEAHVKDLIAGRFPKDLIARLMCEGSSVRLICEGFL